MKHPIATRFVVMLAFSLATAAAWAQTVVMPNELSVELPEGWVLDGSPEGEVSKTGLRRVQFVCKTEACEQTQETCTILMRNEPLSGEDDAAKLREMYASPFKRYFRLRAVLRSTGRDADIRKPLELIHIGDREWYRVETEARHNFKSGLFAETVINGHYVGGICKTCEQGEERHLGGIQLLTSLRSTAAIGN